jgi:hypothetical protein
MTFLSLKNDVNVPVFRIRIRIRIRRIRMFLGLPDPHQDSFSHRIRIKMSGPATQIGRVPDCFAALFFGSTPLSLLLSAWKDRLCSPPPSPLHREKKDYDRGTARALIAEGGWRRWNQMRLFVKVRGKEFLHSRKDE